MSNVETSVDPVTSLMTITKGAVKTHVATIFGVLNVHNRVSAVAAARPLAREAGGGADDERPDVSEPRSARNARFPRRDPFETATEWRTVICAIFSTSSRRPAT
jgi:hypothetical protein